MDQRDAGRLKRYLSTTCALVSARAHRLRMSRHESSRARTSASVTPLTIGTGRRPTLFSLPACLWARDLHNGKSIQHVLAASKSRASEDFGPRRQTRNLDSIGPKTTSPENYPVNLETTQPTATCNRVTTTSIILDHGFFFGARHIVPNFPLTT